MAKKFGVKEKVRYHKNRLQSPKATENQKAYSRHWLDGFTDEHAKGNLTAAESELQGRKRHVADCKKEIAEKRREIKEITAVNNTVFRGYINGMKTKLNNKQGGKRK